MSGFSNVKSTLPAEQVQDAFKIAKPEKITYNQRKGTTSESNLP